jgi:hypothetical protein
MTRALLLSMLIGLAFSTSYVLAQTGDEQQADQSKSYPAASAKSTFATPPSYLESLRSQAAPRSIGSLPRAASASQSTPATPAQPKYSRPMGERKYVWAPTPPVVRTYVSSESAPAAKTPVLQGFTEKNGNFKLRSVSANEPGGLNNKWLELQERELIEKSHFQPPGSPPHTNLY